MRSVGLLALLLLAACGSEPSSTAKSDQPREAKAADPLDKACGANATFDRLKDLVFDEAARVRKARGADFDQLRANVVVRMEEPVETTRDDPMTMVACKGRFIVELPPGVTDAFDGDQRLSAEIDYTVRRAADASGLVYEIKRAEPIVYRLAAFDLTTRVAQQPAEAPIGNEAAAVPTIAPPPIPVLPPPLAEQRPAVRPSYDCRYARSRVERMICSDERLAALDRRMAAQYDDALANASRATRRAIRDSREPFLEFRDDCPDAACVAEAYRDRIQELRDYPVDGWR